MKNFKPILFVILLCAILTGCTHVTPVYSEKEIAPGVKSVTTGTLVISPFARQMSNLNTYTVNANDESFVYETTSSAVSGGDGAGIHLIDQFGKAAIGVGYALQQPDEYNSTHNVGNGTMVKADVQTSARNGNVSGTNTANQSNKQKTDQKNIQQTDQSNAQTASNTSETDVTANPSANAGAQSESDSDSASNSKSAADSSSDSAADANADAQGGDAEAKSGDSNASAGASANSDPWYDE